MASIIRNPSARHPVLIEIPQSPQSPVGTDSPPPPPPAATPQYEPITSPQAPYYFRMAIAEIIRYNDTLAKIVLNPNYAASSSIRMFASVDPQKKVQMTQSPSDQSVNVQTDDKDLLDTFITTVQISSVSISRTSS